MMIIERQAAGGASTGSASGEAIEPTSFLHILLYRDCSLIRFRFHTFVYLDPIADTTVPTAMVVTAPAILAAAFLANSTHWHFTPLPPPQATTALTSRTRLCIARRGELVIH